MDESATHMVALNSLPGGHYMPHGRYNNGGSYYLSSGAAETYNHQIARATSNKSEYELYQLLERANLLRYFEVFLQFGKYSR